MYRHILVPLDGSELAEQVLPLVETLAQSLGGTVTVLRVVPRLEAAMPMKWTMVPPQEAQEALVADAQAYLQAVAARLHGHGISARTITRVGEAAAHIIEAAYDEKADLVAMSTHGYSGIGRWLFGSVADRVVREARTPVLLVRPGQPTLPTRLAHIVIPLDGSPVAERALPHAVGLARATGAKLTLLSIVMVPTSAFAGLEVTYATMEAQLAAARDDMIAYLQALSQRTQGETGGTVETAVEVGPVAEGIIDYTARVGADLIVMSTHGRSGISRWVLGSVADKVAHGATVPVLLIRSSLAPYPQRE